MGFCFLMNDEDHSGVSQQSADADQKEDFDANYPRDPNKRGLLVSLGISVVVIGLLILALV